MLCYRLYIGKKCVKFVWYLFNSENVLFRKIIRYSLHYTTNGQMLSILCISMRLYMMIGLMIFLIDLTEVIIK